MAGRLLGTLTAAVVLAGLLGPADAGPTPQDLSAARATAVKKGAATWAEPGLKDAMARAGVSWFYTWGADPGTIKAPKGVEFVPMMWGAGSVTKQGLADAKASGDTLLGFNEPDLAGQANMTVAQAIRLWPRLQRTRMRLGSPAVAWGADVEGEWLDRFMRQARKKDLRVDFIPVHWYGSDFRTKPAVSQLKSYLVATHDRYSKPIWLTEYALMNFGAGARYPSAAQQTRFVKRSTSMLHRLRFVERYAWFSFPTPTEGGLGTGLFRPGHGLTRMGRAYRDAG